MTLDDDGDDEDDSDEDDDEDEDGDDEGEQESEKAGKEEDGGFSEREDKQDEEGNGSRESTSSSANGSQQAESNFSSTSSSSSSVQGTSTSSKVNGKGSTASTRLGSDNRDGADSASGLPSSASANDSQSASNAPASSFWEEVGLDPALVAKRMKNTPFSDMSLMTTTASKNSETSSKKSDLPPNKQAEAGVTELSASSESLLEDAVAPVLTPESRANSRRMAREIDGMRTERDLMKFVTKLQKDDKSKPKGSRAGLSRRGGALKFAFDVLYLKSPI